MFHVKQLLAVLTALRGERKSKMKRCEFFIIINNADYGKTAFKVKGYMFQKSGHWFTVRRRIPSGQRKWIISDFVTGLAMTDTDSSLEDVQSAVTETMVASMLKLYRSDTVGIYGHRSAREELQQYAQMINSAMFKDNPESKMIDLFQSQCYELFN